MRVVKELTSQGIKITIYSWNNKYLLKFEQGLLEQTFKVKETDVIDDSELLAMIDEEFIQKVMQQFDLMAVALSETQKRNLG
ncbi:MAG TPA: hypothetical protein VD927_13545 [Chryseosolibacter sp.]|nr:hypothetical protein [Chryseosolibacter sp.]